MKNRGIKVQVDRAVKEQPTKLRFAAEAAQVRVRVQIFEASRRWDAQGVDSAGSQQRKRRKARRQMNGYQK